MFLVPAKVIARIQAQSRSEKERREMGNNTERLEAAGIVKKTPLPEQYQSFVDSLSEQEVEALISITDRLRPATDVRAHGMDDDKTDEYFVVL
jgi:hypothetical protein